MRVLLTNNTLDARAGSELYVRDVAVALLRRGHRPVAYSTKLGQVAADLRAATVPVIESLDSLGEAPDIIHGHHHYETLSAMMRYPETPAIYFCHGWIPWEETPLVFPRILRYVAVDELCRERLIVEGGIEPGRIELVLNFFDGSLFAPRSPLPAKPKLALAFGNLFCEVSSLPILREACARCGIELDATGLSAGRSELRPEQLLKRYDVVFAKARAAIEAMAVGTAVVLCNPGRLGPMVSTANFSSLRPLNFGVRTLSRPLDVDLLEMELGQYDAADAMAVGEVVRSECELQPAVDRLITIYEGVIAQAKQEAIQVSARGDHMVARYMEQFAARFKSAAIVEHDSGLKGRCLASEEDRNRWKERCLSSEEDRDRRSQRCLASEEDRDRWTQRCLASEEDRDRWIARGFAAEQDLALTKASLEDSSKEEQYWRARCSAVETTLAERDRELRIAQSDMRELQSWTSWRMTKRMLESWPMQRAARPALRAGRMAWRRLRGRGKTMSGATIQTRAEEMMRRHGFLGVPVATFEMAGRTQRAALISEGMTPGSNLVEFGCGCLRIAASVVPFLDRGNYCGIEPARQRVQYGLQYLFTPEEIALKRPRFDFNERFDTSVFGLQFDFFLARSIWTHASKAQIEGTLDSFVRNSHAASVFLASYLPAESVEEDYQGDGWVGTSHRSDTPGVIKHSLPWIVGQCGRRGLVVREIGGVDCDSQSWLRVTR